jgi:TetR/AcrR family transcriptional regulator
MALALPSQSRKTAPKRRPAVRKRGQGRPKDPNALVGRDAIINATRELLRHRPPSAVTRADIARFAQVDPALIRYYFGTTEALLTAVASQINSEMHARIRAAVKIAGSSEEKLRQRIRTFLAMHAENPHLNQLIVQKILGSRQREARLARAEMVKDSLRTLEDILIEGHRAGRLRAVDPRFLHIALIGMCDFFFTGRPVVDELFPDADERLLESYGEFLADLILGGLAAPSKASTTGKR